MDQTGVILIASNNITYEEKGSCQIGVIGIDEKRAYTLAVGSAADGSYLPIQQVWAGATAKSIPPVDSPGMSDALKAGFHFAFAQSPKKGSHFSTLKTMKEVSV